ncbi:MAG: FHA domain-containing protein, partial [Bdellovibrionales bacterium]|nr:FHA domain-containing protein [Bdellovibrionales bacterium]
MVDEHDEDSLDKTSIMPSETLKVKLESAGQAPPSFVMLVGPAESVGRQWKIEESDRIIGRSINSHIFVDDKSVSKAHSKIVLHNGEVAILDLESTNKTLINGHIIESLVPIILKNNDQIKMGNVIFKFLEKGNVESLSAAEAYDRGTKDALTGCNNKGALMSKGGECFKKSDLLSVPFSLVTFDIDHFKKVN